MKHILIPFTTLVFIMGCGLMNNPKEESEEIHVPQQITVEIPAILKSDNNKTYPRDNPQKSRWYN